MPPRSKKESSVDLELNDEVRAPARAIAPTTALQSDRERFERALSAARAANDAERATALAESTPVVAAEQAAAEAVSVQAERAAAKQAAATEISSDEQTGLIAAMPEHTDVLAAVAAPEHLPERIPERVDEDSIVEPPPSLPQTKKKSTRNERIGVLLVALGALGLLCSVVLAVGALLAAIEIDVDAAFVGAVSDLCDVLVGPLGGLFSFSGENSDARNDLFARGIGSMIYLALGLFLPSVARRRDK